jgi:hypothetical protein
MVAQQGRMNIIDFLAEDYYSKAGSLKQVIEKWQKDGAKLYDHAMPLMVPLRDLWPLREYTWSRSKARRSPEEWDALVKQMKRGWDPKDPAILLVGRAGGAKLGEGNHRLAIAREAKLSKVPVRVLFYEGKVTKTKIPKMRRKPKPKPRPKPARTKPTSPEQDKVIDDIMGILMGR